MDLLRLDAGAGQLLAVRERKIEIRTSGSAGLEPPRDCIVTVARESKRVHDLRSDFAATWPQTRSNGGYQICGSGSERFLHRTHRCRRGTLDSTAPAGMGGADGPAVAVSQENRGTVRYAHANCAGRVISDDHVGLGTMPLRGARSGRDRDTGAMHLPNEQELAGGNTELAGHRLPRGILSSQTDSPGGEEMVRDLEQRPAAQDRAPWCLRPVKTVSRLRQGHGYSRTWIRRD